VLRCNRSNRIRPGVGHGRNKDLHLSATQQALSNRRQPASVSQFQSFTAQNPTVCQVHVQLQTLIWLLRSHCSTVAQLRTSAHYSGPGHAHTLPLSATLCIRLNPVVTTLPRLPCCTVSSPCSVCIFYLVVFSLDLTYFHRT